LTIKILYNILIIIIVTSIDRLQNMRAGS